MTNTQSPAPGVAAEVAPASKLFSPETIESILDELLNTHGLNGDVDEVLSVVIRVVEEKMSSVQPAGHFLEDFGGEGRWQQSKNEMPGMTRPLYTAPPLPAPAQQAAGAEPSAEQITEWAERHDIRGSADVLRTIVDDARSLHLAGRAGS